MRSLHIVPVFSLVFALTWPLQASLADGPPVQCPDCLPFSCTVASRAAGNGVQADILLTNTKPYHTYGIAEADLDLIQGSHLWHLSIPVQLLDEVDGFGLPSGFEAGAPFTASVTLVLSGPTGYKSICQTMW